MYNNTSVNSLSHIDVFLGIHVLLDAPLHGGDFCDPPDQIFGEKECKNAAKSISHPWGAPWIGDNDFPGCFLALDGRNTVYYNKSPNPSTSISDLAENSKKYGAICKKGVIIASA